MTAVIHAPTTQQPYTLYCHGDCIGEHVYADSDADAMYQLCEWAADAVWDTAPDGHEIYYAVYRGHGARHVLVGEYTLVVRKADF